MIYIFTFTHSTQLRLNFALIIIMYYKMEKATKKIRIFKHNHNMCVQTLSLEIKSKLKALLAFKDIL